MGNAKKWQFWKNRENAILKLNNENMEKQFFRLKKELHIIKRGGVTSTIETKFDKFFKKVSMLETSNEIDEEKVTKDNNISLSRDTTDSFLSGTVKTYDKHDI